MREMCLTCRRSTAACLCSQIKSFQTRCRFVLLMHPMEARKERTGTGRLAHVCLLNSEIIVGINFNEERRVRELLRDDGFFPMVLYPGEQSINLTESNSAQIEQLISEKIPLIFVIDGTWPCAKKMMKSSTLLHNLPRLSFSSETKSQFVIKHQPHALCLSTIESIHTVLTELVRLKTEQLDGKHDNLLHVFKAMIQFQIRCAQDPNISSYRPKRDFKDPAQRRPAKKWEKRKLLF